MSAIRGVLLAGQFRTHRELINMSHEDQRNTLIVELDARTNQTLGRLSGSSRRLQAMNDERLAGLGAVYVFLRAARIRTEAELKSMSDDDMRNALIVELAAQPGASPSLRSLDNLSLVLEGLNQRRSQGDIPLPPSYVRGCLIAGGFRGQHALNGMSSDDQRNTLIVEISNRYGQSLGDLSPSNGPRLQAMDDSKLAALAAAYLFLRDAKIRTEAELRTMSADDIRNTLIVEIEGQAHWGVAALQALGTLDLVRIGLGLEPQDRAPAGPLHPPIHHPRMLQFRLRGFSEHESTDSGLQGASDEVYLSAVGHESTRTLFDPITRQVVPVPIDGAIIGDVSSDDVRGSWARDPHVLIEFNLDNPGEHADYPRSYVVTVLAVEHDNADVSELFRQLKDLVGEKAREAITGAAAAGGALVGNLIVPGIGAAVGAAAGALAGLAWDEIIMAVDEGLANDAFGPRVLSIGFHQDLDWPNLLDRPQTLTFWEHGANYTLEYDWHISTD